MAFAASGGEAALASGDCEHGATWDANEEAGILAAVARQPTSGSDGSAMAQARAGQVQQGTTFWSTWTSSTVFKAHELLWHALMHVVYGGSQVGAAPTVKLEWAKARGGGREHDRLSCACEAVAPVFDALAGTDTKPSSHAYYAKKLLEGRRNKSPHDRTIFTAGGLKSRFRINPGLVECMAGHLVALVDPCLQAPSSEARQPCMQQLRAHAGDLMHKLLAAVSRLTDPCAGGGVEGVVGSGAEREGGAGGGEHPLDALIMKIKAEPIYAQHLQHTWRVHRQKIPHDQ